MAIKKKKVARRKYTDAQKLAKAHESINGIIYRVQLAQEECEEMGMKFDKSLPNFPPETIPNMDLALKNLEFVYETLKPLMDESLLGDFGAAIECFTDIYETLKGEG